jgi:stage II sporulation protein D
MITRRTTVATALAAALTTGAALAVGLGHASAATKAPTLTIPPGATITVAGRGFGHGHGLSQYGAQGAARQGQTAMQIVHFYYPHTRSGTARNVFWVQITAPTDNNTTVVARPGLKVRDLGTGTTTPVPTTGPVSKASRWRLSAGPRGTTKVSYLTGAWHVWKNLHGDGELRAAGALRLVLPSSVVTYRGTLQSRSLPATPSRHRVTVNRVALDDYVRGVIPREMPASWLPVALRAQAIAARTYAAFEVADSTNRVYQLCDTSACQVYGGKSAEFPSTNQATTATAGQIRTFHGVPAFTQFSASNGGWMSDGGKPYLVAKKDPFDPWSGNPYRSWTTKVTSAAIEKAWPSLGNLTGITIGTRDGNGRWGGRVVKMTLPGSATANLPVTGDDFRSRLGLRSTCFNLSIAG